MPFRIAGKLRSIAADNGFKQVQIAYLAVISCLVQPSYTLYTNQPFGTTQCLHCCYLPASQRNKHHPRIVAALD